MSVFSVPVTIGVNEEAIANEIKENVEQQVIEKINREVKKQIFSHRYGWGRDNYEDPEPLRNMIKDEIRGVLDDNHGLIVKLAAEILAEKLARTKAVKEKAVSIVEAVLKEE